MKNILTATLLSGAAMLALPAFAAPVNGTEWDDLSRLQIRARAIGVLPDVSSTVNAGGEVDAGDAFAPEVDLSYFISDEFAVEVIAATTQHSLEHNALGDLGNTWILPPTVTLQYHPMRNEKFSPYVGAGINYSYFYGENSAKGNGITDIDIEGGFGYALQVGADYWIDEHWGLNADVKKLYLNVDAKANNGTVRADIDLDPWIVGVGVSYRF